MCIFMQQQIYWQILQFLLQLWKSKKIMSLLLIVNYSQNWKGRIKKIQKLID